MAVIFVQVPCVLVLVLTAALAVYVVFGRRPSTQMEDRMVNVWKHKHPHGGGLNYPIERVTAG